MTKYEMCSKLNLTKRRKQLLSGWNIKTESSWRNYHNDEKVMREVKSMKNKISVYPLAGNLRKGGTDHQQRKLKNQSKKRKRGKDQW